MTYDDADWHHDTTDELGLSDAAACTHIGMFYAWARARGLASGTRLKFGVADPVADDAIHLLDERALTPGAYAHAHLSAQLDPGFFTDEGRAFVDERYGAFLEAYERIPAVVAAGNFYTAEDTWQLYNAVEPVLDELYAQWKRRL